MFLLFGLHSTVTGFESPKTFMIPLLVTTVAVPVSTSSGTDGNKFVNKLIFHMLDGIWTFQRKRKIAIKVLSLVSVVNK